MEDLSKKRKMDLRLLHGVAYGHSWFGRWGYRFCNGSFGVTHHNYHRAIEVLSSVELDNILSDYSNKNQHREIKQMTRYYRDLSETNLITIRDLFRFMLTLKSQRKSAMVANSDSSSSPYSYSRPPTRIIHQNKPPAKEKSVKCRKFSAAVANMDSRWPTRRLEYAAQVIVDALRERRMTRQEVRDAARQHIGDTGLLDYVLKSLNNMIVGDFIVQRSVNSSTRVLEYSIKQLDNDGTVREPNTKIHPEQDQSQPILPLTDVYSDVVYLYKNILLNYPNSELVESASRIVLDSKRFIKEWQFRDEDDQSLRFICRVTPSYSELYGELTRELPPGDIVTVPLYATVAELKEAIRNAMRDTYCIMSHFEVTEIEELEKEDEEVVFGAIESGSEVWIRGHGLDLGTQLRYEGGADNWTVRCECGARDDDGERMVSCDICEVWQHTRCCGIEAVPPLFVCQRCCATLVPSRREELAFEGCDEIMMPPLPELEMDYLC